MRGMVPRDPSWCSRCKLEGVCDDHKGPEGRPTLYEGPDVYEPSDWVQTVVGSAYQGYSYDDGRCRVWRCFGYDPRHGFWDEDHRHRRHHRSTSRNEPSTGPFTKWSEP